MYRVQEFAGLAGVTVRALHHYDHLGLLKPLRNGRTGYRLYRDADFARLEQIVVLKFLGVPLREIGPLLKTRNLRDVVQRQRHVLLERRQQIDSAMRAIQKVEHALDSAGTPDWHVFTLVVREISMQNDTTWTKKYYSESAQTKVEARRAMWSPELQEFVTAQWTRLIADVEAAIARNEDPKGVAGQVLAARWEELVAGFTGRDPEIQQGLNKMWADRANWPEGKAKSFRMPSEVVAFIARVRK